MTTMTDDKFFLVKTVNLHKYLMCHEKWKEMV